MLVHTTTCKPQHGAKDKHTVPTVLYLCALLLHVVEEIKGMCEVTLSVVARRVCESKKLKLIPLWYWCEDGL